MAHDCVGAMLVREGRVLLGLRAPDAAWLADAWDIFGGHVEAGETAEDALRRELREELGIEAGALEPLGTIAGDLPEPWRLKVYRVRAWTGAPRAHREGGHAAMRWCDPGEARDHLLPAHPGFGSLLAAAFASGAASIAEVPVPDPGSTR